MTGDFFLFNRACEGEVSAHRYIYSDGVWWAHAAFARSVIRLCTICILLSISYLFFFPVNILLRSSLRTLNNLDQGEIEYKAGGGDTSPFWTIWPLYGRYL